MTLMTLTNHDSSSFRVDRQILARNNTSAATFTISLLMDFFKHILGWVVFKDDNPSRVRTHNKVILSELQ